MTSLTSKSHYFVKFEDGTIQEFEGLYVPEDDREALWELADSLQFIKNCGKSLQSGVLLKKEPDGSVRTVKEFDKNIEIDPLRINP